MSKPAFTPGQWSAVNQGSQAEPMMSVLAERISGNGPTHCVAICAPGDSAQEMEDANARLIAAAPDMYEALRQCQEYLKFSLGSTSKINPFPAMDAALAKAEGRS